MQQEQPSSQPLPTRRDTKQILTRLVNLSAESVALDACRPFHPPVRSPLGGLPVSSSAADNSAKEKPNKHLRSICTTSKDRLNTIDMRIAPLVKQARPILSTRQGKKELKPIMDRAAREFRFDSAQKAALPFAVAVATGVTIVHVG
ncbi:hypothetical protein ACFWBC_33510 [Streptomyces sp. NPDC059985]|uniref:hypothetical protein n=1 Tax=Streptomyces sp. NPDC059985 TaxID=3347025 RepID=UPI0036A98A02